MFRSFRQHMLANSLATALLKRAQAIGESAKNNELCSYYERKAQLIDPEEDHWGFADARQKFMDYANDTASSNTEVHRWGSRIHHLEQQLKQVYQPATKRPFRLWFFTAKV